MLAKACALIGVESCLFAGLLFGAADTFDWPEAWWFLAVLFGSGSLASVWIARTAPDLLAERMKSPFQAGQPAWDKAFLGVMLILFPAWLFFIGLDARRFAWSHMPWPLEALGDAGVLASMLFCALALGVNPFAAHVVRVQRERQQHVISTGLYAYVRHPLYAGLTVFFPAIALALGSWWGLATSLIFLVAIAIRAIFEERELEQYLDGYRDYEQRVRWRLLPGIW